MLLPHEQELIDAGTTTLPGLVAQYRVLFATCWDVMTAEQQADVTATLKTAGLMKEDADG